MLTIKYFIGIFIQPFNASMLLGTLDHLYYILSLNGNTTADEYFIDYSCMYVFYHNLLLIR